jgi:phytoene synthase
MSIDLNICKEIMRKAGKTYYFATKIFPKEIREATYALYAFYRVPDDMVDLHEDLNLEAKTALLHEWRKKWQDCITNKGESDEAVLRTAYEVHKKYKIEFIL